MQKRRGGGSDHMSSRSSGGLPMTEADLVATSSSSRRVRRKRRVKRKGGSFLVFGPTFWSGFVVAVICLLGIFVIKSFFGSTTSLPTTNRSIQTQQDSSAVLPQGPRLEAKKRLPLSHFPSLSYALENAELVALYFAASWCPMSTPVTQKLDSVFSQTQGVLLSPSGGGGATNNSKRRRPLAIVYVSSDKSNEEMLQYSKEGWINVPFKSKDRSELKKHFRVCAKKELPELGIDRKFEIPSLFILDGLTHGVITTNGVEDLESEGSHVLERWQELQHIIRGMEDKYID